MRAAMRATRILWTPGVNFMTWSYLLVPEGCTSVHGHKICGKQGVPRVIGHVTKITRIALAISRTVAIFVLPNRCMYQLIARFVARHNYIWDVIDAVVWVAILLYRLVTENVRRGRTCHMFALQFGQVLVVVRIVDICVTSPMQIHVVHTTTKVLASLHGKQMPSNC